MISNAVGRDPLIDKLKGYAIFLVIWVHSIACLGEGKITSSQPIGTLILLFIMPLFFLLSGYVSVNALSRSFGNLLKYRFKSLFIPMCLWALIGLAVKISLKLQVLPDAIIGITMLKTCVLEIMGAYWFIWALLACIFYAWIVQYIGQRYKIWALIISVLLLPLLPELPYIQLNLFKCMYPFFVAGYLFRKYRVFDWIQKHMLLNLILWGGVFVLCFVIYKSSYLMYSVHLNVWVKGVRYVVLHLFYLIAAGFSGTILSYQGMKLVTDRVSVSWLADIGSYTFAIYMAQGILFNAVFAAYQVDLSYQTLYFLVAIIITYILWKLAVLMSRSQILSATFIGKS